MNEGKEKMNQSSELFTLKRGVFNTFRNRVRLMVDEPDDRGMWQIFAETASRINHFEQLVKSHVDQFWTTEPELMRIEEYAKGAVAKRVSQCRILKAHLQRNFAKHSGREFQVAEVDDEQIKCETFIEVEDLWHEITDGPIARGLHFGA